MWRLSRASRLGSLTGLLLTGYAVGSLLAAGLSMAMVLSGAQLRQIVFFLLGSLATATWQQVAVAAPLIIAGVVVLVWRARALDALMLGDETAAHLGLAVARERVILLAFAALVTAAAVATCGLIGFVGLVVPHMVRLVVGPAARPLLPLAAIFGAAFLALADLLARLPGELPVGIVTARHRRAVLPADPAPRPHGLRAVSELRLVDVALAYGSRTALAGLDLTVAERRTGRRPGPQRRRQVEPPALRHRGPAG